MVILFRLDFWRGGQYGGEYGSVAVRTARGHWLPGYANGNGGHRYLDSNLVTGDSTLVGIVKPSADGARGFGRSIRCVT